MNTWHALSDPPYLTCSSSSIGRRRAQISNACPTLSQKPIQKHNRPANTNVRPFQAQIESLGCGIGENIIYSQFGILSRVLLRLIAILLDSYFLRLDNRLFRFLLEVFSSLTDKI